ncbi:histone deacetylase family protein [candidate division KSB1 bacterium]|nr:histone deacetylase family protein [candidate division KSB1 bacterium]
MQIIFKRKSKDPVKLSEKRAVVLYSEEEKLHSPNREWNFGRTMPYPENEERGQTIINTIKKHDYGSLLHQTRQFDDSYIKAVHDNDMVQHIKSCMDLDEGQAVYPHVFPYHQFSRRGDVNLRAAGYFCFDVGTQIQKHTYRAAKAAADIALDGALCIREKRNNIVFGLCRPPGHHADYNAYGGYCYFNNAAIAANVLAGDMRTAILDLDFHHGNGTQGLFYENPHILYVSIHGDPRVTYPYFSGFADESGSRLGRGYNINIPLTGHVDDKVYRNHLKDALKKIKAYGTEILIVSIGFDTYYADPLGDFDLSSGFYHEMGYRIQQNFPCTLALLEGGYDIEDLGLNAVNFLKGLLG